MPTVRISARASTITAQFDDGGTESIVVATCRLPCGWNGPVVPTTMTPVATDRPVDDHASRPAIESGAIELVGESVIGGRYAEAVSVQI